jgi:hypothetical protein
VEEWDGCSFFDENELLALNPNLSKAEVLNEDCEFCFADCQGDGEELETEAKRSGPKSSAQTPAKPEEKRSGSSKNSPGSAETSSEKSIQFSKKIIETLKSKVKEHNSKYSKKVTLNQLKKVFRRGAGAFSSSHRPGKTRVQWAMARVNMFLKMVSGKPVKQAYKAADKDIAKASSFLYVDINPDDESFDLADKDITNADLIGYNDFTEEDLYFNDDYDESAFSKRINLLI